MRSHRGQYEEKIRHKRTWARRSRFKFGTRNWLTKTSVTWDRSSRGLRYLWRKRKTHLARHGPLEKCTGFLFRKARRKPKASARLYMPIVAYEISWRIEIFSPAEGRLLALPRSLFPRELSRNCELRRKILQEGGETLSGRHSSISYCYILRFCTPITTCGDYPRVIDR